MGLIALEVTNIIKHFFERRISARKFTLHDDPKLFHIVSYFVCIYIYIYNSVVSYTDLV